jgi:outer membrane protein assembly factor BamB
MGKILLIIVLLIASSPVYASRISAPEVKSVIYEGIKYSVHGNDSIQATEAKTGQKIWTKQIYIVKYLPGLEEDVQDCFITKLEIRNNKAYITNEKGYEYELDLNTLEIKIIKGFLIIDRQEELKGEFKVNF